MPNDPQHLRSIGQGPPTQGESLQRCASVTGKRRRRPSFSTAGTLWLTANVVIAIIGGLLFAFGAQPSHVKRAGTVEVVPQSATLEALGISLLGASIAGLALLGYVMVTDSTRQRLELMWDVGFRSIFHTNTTSIQGAYNDTFNRQPKSIDLLGTGLDRFRVDFHADLLTWAQSGRTVRILLVNPTYPAAGAHSLAAIRDLDENNAGTGIAGQVEAFLADGDVVAALAYENFDVRLYTALPTVTMVRADDNLYWSPYFYKRRPSSSPTLLVRRGGVLFDTLAEHFDDIWTDPQRTTSIKTQPLNA